MTSDIVKITKGWGHELIFANKPTYCGKLMHFEDGKKTSMHFHAIKEETFYVISGYFMIVIINTTDASKEKYYLAEGNKLEVKKNTPHQICAITGGDLIEVSTHDDPSDSYRVETGASQQPENKYDRTEPFKPEYREPSVDGDLNQSIYENNYDTNDNYPTSFFFPS